MLYLRILGMEGRVVLTWEQNCDFLEITGRSGVLNWLFVMIH